MKITKKEHKLMDILTEKENWVKDSLKVERKSDKEFDLLINGENDLCGFSAWLPLSAIHAVNWPKYAWLSSYPEMVHEGDWSGIRDSDPDQIWDMFSHALTELTKGD